MDRRQFAHTLAASALAVASPALPGAQTPAAGAATPFPLSVMLWTVFNDLPFEQRLERVVEAGYTNIELVGEYAQWSPADFDRANAALACPAMIVLSGNVVPGLKREEQHQSCIDSLKKAAALVEGRQIDGQPVRLLLECIDPEENPHYYLQSAAEGMDIVRAVNHPQVQFLYDLFHEQIAEGNLLEKLQKNIDIVGLIHVADVPGRHEPGTGEINYANIYRTLARLNYRHMVAMEFKPSGDPVTTLRAARADAIRAAQV
jgi:hydroxypyruvate isomerase